MYRRINSASRIHAVLERLTQESDGQIAKVLATALKVQLEPSSDLGLELLPAFTWFLDEVALVRSQADSLGLPAHLYDHAFSRVRSVLNPVNIAGGWNSMRGNLTPDVLLAFAYLNELLPDEESEIPSSTLNEIVEQLDALRAALAASDVPAPIRAFVQHQMDLIARALRQYPIVGAKAIREAGRTAYGELAEVKGTAVGPIPEAAKDAVSRLQRLWAKVNEAGEIALKAEKLGQLGNAMSKAVLEFMNGG